MNVYIAEKPSLAEAIFKGLGGCTKSQKENGYFKNGDDIVTWCFGHMLELFDPADYDDKYKKWSLDNLPLPVNYPPKFKVKSSASKQVAVIKSLLKQASVIINAGDPDDEGQLLVDELIEYFNCDQPVKRLLIADLNDNAVKKSLQNIDDNEKYLPNKLSALSRAIGDKLYGYNLTQVYTLKAQQKGFTGLLHIGRVQSAILGFVNQRTLANLNHQKSYYYELSADFDFENIGIVSAKLISDKNDLLDDKNRLIDEKAVSAIAHQIKNKNAMVTSSLTKNVATAAPLAFNLSTLQQTCSKKYGFKPEKTTKLLQSLYETHKVVTYPRSDCRFLSDEHFNNRDAILSSINTQDPSFNAVIEKVNHDKKHAAFNSDNITAHHGIIPSEKDKPVTLSNDEKIVYELIAKSFIALFLDDAVRECSDIEILCDERLFKTSKKKVIHRGWESLYDNEDKESQENLLAKIKSGALSSCIQSNVLKKETKPEKYFTDSTLLSAMTKAAKYCSNVELKKALELKDKDNKAENGSIGTEATRASIMEKCSSNSELFELKKIKGYKELAWMTTKRGQELCALLPSEITSPDVSAIWSMKQAEIKSGDLSIEQFIDYIASYLHEQVEHAKNTDLAISIETHQCPNCETGKLIKRNGKYGDFWACNNYPSCKTNAKDKNNTPCFDSEAKKKKVENVSSNFVCEKCGSGLIRRKSNKKKNSFYWTCSSFPKCKCMMFDKANKPDFSTAKYS